MPDEHGSALLLTPTELARLLGVDVETILAHVEAGAPTDDAGRLHVIHYAAWLLCVIQGKDSSSNGDGPAKTQGR